MCIIYMYTHENNTIHILEDMNMNIYSTSYLLN